MPAPLTLTRVGHWPVGQAESGLARLRESLRTGNYSVADVDLARDGRPSTSRQIDAFQRQWKRDASRVRVIFRALAF